MTGSATLPADGGIDLVQREGGEYLFERYKEDGEGSIALRGYYLLRPLIPRGVQLAMRRRYAKRQARVEFPRWPVESVLVDKQHDELRRLIAERGDGRVPFVNFWPRRHRFAWTLTHDVEGTLGVERIAAVREVERRHGVVSSWNFCAEEYPIPDGLLDWLKEEGCEVGLHAIDHSGKLFLTRERFEQDLPKIHAYLRDWDIEGFRSPALHRNAEWMPELGAAYDTSYPDSDPFEPQAGGCCWPFPFFNGEMVELPVTLLQDHTHWEILRKESIEHWPPKIDWLEAVGGLVTPIVHPDYVLSDERLALYEQLIVHLRSRTSGWHALPREVAAWWRARANLTLVQDADGNLMIPGGDELGATVAWAREDAGRIVYDV